MCLINITGQNKVKKLCRSKREAGARKCDNSQNPDMDQRFCLNTMDLGLDTRIRIIQHSCSWECQFVKGHANRCTFYRETCEIRTKMATQLQCLYLTFRLSNRHIAANDTRTIIFPSLCPWSLVLCACKNWLQPPCAIKTSSQTCSLVCLTQ